MKINFKDFIRNFLAVLLLYQICKEAGPFTALTMLLFYIFTEVTGPLLARYVSIAQQLMSVFSSLLDAAKDDKES